VGVLFQPRRMGCSLVDEIGPVLEEECVIQPEIRRVMNKKLDKYLAMICTETMQSRGNSTKPSAGTRANHPQRDCLLKALH
jgi:hypothetical protein